MPFQKGNKLSAFSKQGNGRKSLKDEYWHKDKWEKDTILKELQAKIRTGVFSIRDRVLLMALEGDQKIATKFMDKCLADLHEVAGEGGGPIQISWQK